MLHSSIYGASETGIQQVRSGYVATSTTLKKGQPVARYGKSDDVKSVWCGVAMAGNEFAGIASKDCKYGDEASNLLVTEGVCEARVEAQSTMLPGTWLLPQFGDADSGTDGYWEASVVPTGVELLTDLSAGTADEVYGPENLLSGVVPKVRIHPNALNGVLIWEGHEAADADQVSVSASPGSGTIVIAANPDVPRNLTYTSAGNDSGITFTAVGTDFYGDAISETTTGANAGVATGAKAFKTVTSITQSGAVAGALTVGTGVLLGLPRHRSARIARAAYLDTDLESTAPTIVNDVDEVEKNTITTDTTLNTDQLTVFFEYA